MMPGAVQNNVFCNVFRFIISSACN